MLAATATLEHGGPDSPAARAVTANGVSVSKVPPQSRPRDEWAPALASSPAPEAAAAAGGCGARVCMGVAEAAARIASLRQAVAAGEQLRTRLRVGVTALDVDVRDSPLPSGPAPQPARDVSHLLTSSPQPQRLPEGRRPAGDALSLALEEVALARARVDVAEAEAARACE